MFPWLKMDQFQDWISKIFLLNTKERECQKMSFKFVKPIRAVDRVFCHCSDSDYPQHDNVETIRSWHVDGNGWQDIGYHFVITSDGTIHAGRDIELIPAAQYGHNTGTIAICLTGKTKFTKKQKKALQQLCKQINEAYSGEISFHGHKEVDPGRLCPVYDYKAWLVLNEDGSMQRGFYDRADC